MQHSILQPSIFIQSYPHLHPPQSLPPTVIRSPAIESFKLKLGGSSFSFTSSIKDGDFGCRARRRVIFEDDEEGDDEYNSDIAVLEFYSQSAKQEALIVKATVDDSEEEILIFKGFSSSLSYGTSPDPSKSILPARAVVKAIDRVKGPFNPTDIQYIEKGLTLDDFKARLRPN
ncbi:unnamed protein product [Rhodiola kirilowii]